MVRARRQRLALLLALAGLSRVGATMDQERAVIFLDGARDGFLTFTHGSGGLFVFIRLATPANPVLHGQVIRADSIPGLRRAGRSAVPPSWDVVWEHWRAAWLELALKDSRCVAQRATWQCAIT